MIFFKLCMGSGCGFLKENIYTSRFPTSESVNCQVTETASSFEMRCPTAWVTNLSFRRY